MSVKDFIKKSILDSGAFTQTYTVDTLVKLVTAMIVALIIGFIICFLYTRFYRGVVYSRTFAYTLIGMSVLTCMVTLAISTNVVISLGMVGALSIVRYRTAIKEPMDLFYLFWAITSGIAAGAQMYVLILISMVIIFIMLLIMNRKKLSGQVFIMIVHYTGTVAGDEVRKAMGNAKFRIKSKTMRKDFTEVTIEVFTKVNNLSFTEKIQAIENVSDVTLVQYDGEYHG